MRKIFAVALTAVALFGAAATVASDAEARRWHRSAGIALGVGLLGVGIAHAITRPNYVRECNEVDRYDRYGNYRGTRVVCQMVPY